MTTRKDGADAALRYLERKEVPATLDLKSCLFYVSLLKGLFV